MVARVLDETKRTGSLRATVDEDDVSEDEDEDEDEEKSESDQRASSCILE
jgi:hypothetical protein